MLLQEKNVSTMKNSNCMNEPYSATTVQMINELSSVDYLLDYKLRNMIEVLRDNIEDLHTEINEGETRETLLIRSNKVCALFEMLVDLLPKTPDYFEKVQMLTGRLLTQKSA